MELSSPFISECIDSYETVVRTLLENSVCKLTELTRILDVITDFSETDQTNFWTRVGQEHHLVEGLLRNLIDAEDSHFVSE